MQVRIGLMAAIVVVAAAGFARADEPAKACHKTDATPTFWSFFGFDAEVLPAPIAAKAAGTGESSCPSTAKHLGITFCPTNDASTEFCLEAKRVEASDSDEPRFTAVASALANGEGEVTVMCVPHCSTVPALPVLHAPHAQGTSTFCPPCPTCPDGAIFTWTGTACLDVEAPACLNRVFEAKACCEQGGSAELTSSTKAGTKVCCDDEAVCATKACCADKAYARPAHTTVVLHGAPLPNRPHTVGPHVLVNRHAAPCPHAASDPHLASLMQARVDVARAEAREEMLNLVVQARMQAMQAEARLAVVHDQQEMFEELLEAREQAFEIAVERAKLEAQTEIMAEYVQMLREKNQEQQKMLEQLVEAKSEVRQLSEKVARHQHLAEQNAELMARIHELEQQLHQERVARKPGSLLPMHK